MSAYTLALFLSAIAAVEGWNGRVGASGERGPYQMTPAVVAEVGGFDEAAAGRKVRKLEAAFKRSGLDPSVYDLAAAWNGGFKRAIRKRPCEATRDYASRVQNLFEWYTRNPPKK